MKAKWMDLTELPMAERMDAIQQIIGEHSTTNAGSTFAHWKMDSQVYNNISAISFRPDGKGIKNLGWMSGEYAGPAWYKKQVHEYDEVLLSDYIRTYTQEVEL